MATIASRHAEFLAAGARVIGVSVDPPAQNAHVMAELALPFPILSDPGRERAITPLGFADEADPRQISRPGTVVLAPGAEETWRHIGRDYADRPHEDVVLAQVSALDLPPTTQGPPAVGEAAPGPNAVTLTGLRHYLRGAKFTALALRSRHRDLGQAFRDDAKEYVARVERYMEALSEVEARRALM